MKKQTILLLLFTLVLFACKKEKNKPYSYWTVNGQEFTTNETEVYYGKVGIEFRSTDLFPDGFFIYFQNNNSFPALDSILTDSSGIPNTVRFDIVFRDTGFIPYFGNQVYLHKSIVKGHMRFDLKGNWLYHGYRPNEDSVWATGTFIVP